MLTAEQLLEALLVETRKAAVAEYRAVDSEGKTSILQLAVNSLQYSSAGAEEIWKKLQLTEVHLRNLHDAADAFFHAKIPPLSSAKYRRMKTDLSVAIIDAKMHFGDLS